jgi:hypothetical protein
MPWLGEVLGKGAPARARTRRMVRAAALVGEDTCGPERDPSWGPVGSLLQKHDPALYEHILAQHQQMLAREQVA